MSKLRIAAAVLVAAVFLIQLVPYRVDHPPVTQELVWDDPAIEAMVDRSCGDCHSNETRVPWYGQIAPVAWYVNDHVQEGREHLNFSELDQPQRSAHEAGEVVVEAEMPPDYYLRMHPEAALTAAQRETLSAALDRNLRPYFRKDRKRNAHE